MNVMVVLRHNS